LIGHGFCDAFFDCAQAGGLPVLIALVGTLLNKNTKGGLIVVGILNLGGSTELLPNAVALLELAIDKQAASILMPIAARKQLNDLLDEYWTKIQIEFYKRCDRCSIQSIDGVKAMTETTQEQTLIRCSPK